MRKQPPSILHSKGEFTKFQILLEVMRNQPHVKQKDISESLGITIQAISKYFKRLTRGGMLEAGSERADYRLTPKATVKLHEDLRKLEWFVSEIRRQIKVEHAWPAIATKPVKSGEQVGLFVKEGVLYTVASDSPLAEAKGIVLVDAAAGEDVVLKDLQGKIQVRHGKILIVTLPSIRRGGSREVDLEKIRAFYDEFKPDRIGVMGTVGRAVLNKLGLKANIEFGVGHSAAIAASRGLDVFVLVVGRMVNRIIEEIDEINLKSSSEITYEVKDGRLS